MKLERTKRWELQNPSKRFHIFFTFLPLSLFYFISFIFILVSIQFKKSTFSCLPILTFSDFFVLPDWRLSIVSILFYSILFSTSVPKILIYVSCFFVFCSASYSTHNIYIYIYISSFSFTYPFVPTIYLPALLSDYLFPSLSPSLLYYFSFPLTPTIYLSTSQPITFISFFSLPLSPSFPFTS